MLHRRHHRDLGNLRSRIIAPAIARTVIEELEARRLLTILMTGTSFTGTETFSQMHTVATFTDDTPRWDIIGSHKYTRKGDFTVKLSINDGGGSSVEFNSKAHVT